jgi:hypothetical protein
MTMARTSFALRLIQIGHFDDGDRLPSASDHLWFHRTDAGKYKHHEGSTAGGTFDAPHHR